MQNRSTARMIDFRDSASTNLASEARLSWFIRDFDRTQSLHKRFAAQQAKIIKMRERSLYLAQARTSSLISAIVIVILLTWFNNGFLQTVESADGSQSCHLREMDLCATMALSFLQNPNGIPVTDVEIDRQCGFLKEAQDCADSYTSRCLESINQALVEMFFGKTRMVREEFCTNGTALRDTYKQHAPCMNEAFKQFRKTCLADLQVGFEAIHKFRPVQRIPLGCCNMNRFEACVCNQIHEKCGEGATEFIESVIDRMISRMPRVFCRDFDPESRRCTEILPEKGTKPHVGRNTSSISRLLSTYTNINQFL